ncbi:MAG: hypothetical protein AAGA55_03140 [Planctomycetota bacterium]
METTRTDSKHTPGPWSLPWCMGMLRHISRNVDTDAFFYQDEDDDSEVVYPNYYHNGGVDAHLIAAAPDLLEACQELLLAEQYAESAGVTIDDHMKRSDRMACLREAIAKAEGGAA